VVAAKPDEEDGSDAGADDRVDGGPRPGSGRCEGLARTAPRPAGVRRRGRGAAVPDTARADPERETGARLAGDGRSLVRRGHEAIFTKPPALHSQLQTRNEIPPTLIGPFNRSGQPSRRKTRKKNVSYLTMASTSVKDDIKTWVREIRVAVTHARNAQPGP
jgi:hypothetical protein